MPHIAQRLFDDAGNPLVFVTLANSSTPAVLAEDDYRRVVSAIGQRPWRYDRGHVLDEYGCTIARLLLGVSYQTRVGYRDRNATNLRPDNLFRAGAMKPPKRRAA